MDTTDEIQVTIIGAGTSVPAPKRSPASILLRAGPFSALLDIGPGTLSKLPLYGIDAFALDHIFITHLHPDHVLDLATFFLISDYAPDYRKELPLFLIGPKGLNDFVTHFMQLFPDIAPPTFKVNIREMTENILKLEKVQISTIRSGHTPDSISFRFEFKMGIFVYTGDCTYSSALEEFCRGADVLVCECSYPEGYITKDHMTPRYVGALSQNAKVKQLIVTHLYPPALEVDLIKQIQQFYTGQLIIAQDGTHITI